MRETNGIRKMSWQRASQLMLLVTLLSGAVWFVGTISSTTTGWEITRIHWQNALLGPLGFGHEPIDWKAPFEQADLWLGEVNQVLQRNPESAALAMGAAIVLDSPGPRFRHRYWEDQTRYFLESVVAVQDDAMDAASAPFESKCREECLRLAEQATRLDPADVRWWRLRAMLLFQMTSDLHFIPRSPSWLSALDECARHDPDNALYDYLAAIQLWSMEGKRAVPEDVRVIAALAINGGNTRFLAAQQKPFFAVGEEGLSAAAEFLTQTAVPRIDQRHVLVSRGLAQRQWAIYRQLAKRIEDQVYQVRGVKNRDAEITLSQQHLRLFEQFQIAMLEECPRATWQFLDNYAALQDEQYATMSRLRSDKIDKTGPAERERLARERTASLTQTRLLQQALAERYVGDERIRKRQVLGAMLSGMTLEAAVWLLPLGALLIGSTKRFGKPAHGYPKLGRFHHVTAWLIGMTAAIMLQGVAAAEIISRPQQETITALIILGFVGWLLCAAIWYLCVFLAREQHQFGLRAAFFALTLGTVAIYVSSPLMMDVFVRKEPTGYPLWIPAKGWNGVEAEVLRLGVFALEKASWLWATVQAYVQGVHYTGPLAALLLILIASIRRAAKLKGERSWQFARREFKLYWPAWSREVGHSALVGGLVGLAAYLWVAPFEIRASNRHQQVTLQAWQDPVAYRNELTSDRKETAVPENIAKVQDAELQMLRP